MYVKDIIDKDSNIAHRNFALYQGVELINTSRLLLNDDRVVTVQDAIKMGVKGVLPCYEHEGYFAIKTTELENFMMDNAEVNISDADDVWFNDVIYFWVSGYCIFNTSGMLFGCCVTKLMLRNKLLSKAFNYDARKYTVSVSESILARACLLYEMG